MGNILNLLLFVLFLAAVTFSEQARAQLSGHNNRGDFGLLSASQPPPGWYLAAPMYYRYSADEFRDHNGDRLLSTSATGSVQATAWIAGAIWVSEHKIFGGNYGFSIWSGATDNALEFPSLDLDQSTSMGLADTYIQPINLGWSTPRADFIAGLGIYAPTGKYEAGGSDNRGLGMWSYELFGGATAYFDEARTWHFAATAFFETHGKKEGTHIRVGNLLTIEGGLGKSFMDGATSAGVAFYAQWKLSEDEFGTARPPALPDSRLSKHRVYGIGPEVNLPLMTSQTLWGFLSLRYLWETGARSTLQGSTFVATLTLPLPGIPLQ